MMSSILKFRSLLFQIIINDVIQALIYLPTHIFIQPFIKCVLNTYHITLDHNIKMTKVQCMYLRKREFLEGKA